MELICRELIILKTEIIGFGEHEEGKTMGLAPYGTNAYYEKIRKYISYDGNAGFKLSSNSILEMVQLKEDVRRITSNEKKKQVCADIAWAGQQILEEIYVDISRYLWEQTHCNNLCIAGGVALNSVANYKVYKKNLFQNIFIQPASGDDGTAIGAAYYGYFEENSKK